MKTLRPAALFFALVLAAAPAFAEGGGLKEFSASPVFNWYGVDGDEGRFRQDWRVPDESSGGFEDMQIVTADEKFQLSGHAIVHNDYGHDGLLVLPGDGYLKVNGKYFRQYYDGSNEPWVPSDYLLPEEFADWEDEDLYADRLSQTIEYGRKLGENGRIAFGYELWGRYGRERLLRGEQAARTGRVSLRSIPNRATLDGTSHTFYAQYDRLIADKYNFSLRPSFEMYKDSQYVDFARFNNGALQQDRTFFDSPEFQDFNLQAKVDTFCTQDIYFHTGYLFTYLHNGFVRSEVRTLAVAGVPGAPTFTDPNVDNQRIGHTGNLGAVILRLFGLQGLRLSASSRAEGTNTNSRGFGTAGSAVGNSGSRESRSDMGEFWVSESLDLSYTGIPKASFGLSADLDQRSLDYDEFFDARNHESVRLFGSSNNLWHFNADYLYNNLKTTARASYRFNERLKVSSQYRFRYQHRDVDVNEDTEAVFYPGVLLDTRRNTQEATVGADIRLTDQWFSGLKYQYVGDDFHTNLGDSVQESDRHRVTASLTGQPAERLTLIGTATFESYLLDTPADVPAGSNWFDGESPYDFSADYLIYSIGASYRFWDGWRGNASFQQTSSFGTYADVQKNDLYEIRAGLSRDFDKDTRLSADYVYFEFDDRNDVVPGFDDYDGHGIVLVFSKKLA